MTAAKRLLVLPAVAVVCVAEMCRRGFAAPLAYGLRQWYAAFLPNPNTESD